MGVEVGGGDGVEFHPGTSYRHLLVRVTGYNAYFTAIGRELQDEIIARQSHVV